MPQFRVTITGVVQGVGFRPFVYRTAVKNNIRGYIKNAGNSVELAIEGDEAKVKEFLNTIKNEHPPLSRISNIDIKPFSGKNFSDFQIRKSEKDGVSDSEMPPDVAICDACLGEMLDRTNRRYLFPFTVCTDCGPRFTIIESLPYDRENTTMSEFSLCGSCGREYHDPENRRFRAEPVCCPDCGPSYELYMGNENTFSKEPIRDAALAIDEGKIVAIKGIGGTHLCASTIDDDAIKKMRTILNRPNKPFAIMARDIREALRLACISPKEEKLLLSPERPIVLLKKKNLVSPLISPGLDNTGIMLPYSGLHHLLFYYSSQPALVMTSANVPGEPMAIDNHDILSVNSDLSLIHDRRIKNRCDDSVIKIVNDNPLFIRRSRGFVPAPVKVRDTGMTLLSLGAELDVTACILKKGRAFLTQYIGNTTKLRTVEYLGTAVQNLMEFTGTDTLDAVAVDMHPSFNTSSLGIELSRKFDVPLIKCQHHFAHAASLMAECGHEKMVCIVADGVGFGSDGTIWGGEIIAIDGGSERLGSLSPQLMPGGDLAARFPARMALSVLSKKFEESDLHKIFAPYFETKELSIVLKQIETKFNSPLTSSTGRILDCIAALLGVCTERTYEGEPAMKLEAFANKGKDVVDIPADIKKSDGRYVLDTTGLVEAVFAAREEHSLHDIAASAQVALAEGLCGMAIRAARDKKIDIIGFSGGVAYNDAIICAARRMTEEQGFEFVVHTKVPCGDGGISLGQAMLGALELNRDGRHVLF